MSSVGAGLIGSRLVVLGQGYVGLPLSIAATEAGFDVVGFDTDESRVSSLEGGSSYVPDVSDFRLSAAIDSGRFLATANQSDLAGFSIAVVTVPTPLTNDAPDLRFISSAAELLSQHIRPGALIVLESTTYPGTTEELFIPMLESKSKLQAGQQFMVSYSPERIDPGNRDWDLGTIPKLVSGVNQGSMDAACAFYESLGTQTVRVDSMRDAEMAKLIENTFRHVNIALVNELAMFANFVGVNIWRAIEAAGTKPFGFMRFDPGPGVGGHCLPVDPLYLSWAIERSTGAEFEFVKLANRINKGMPNYVAGRLSAILGEADALTGLTVLIVGLAYKKNTGDLRESPSLQLAEILSSRGALVHALDPLVRDEDWPGSISRSKNLDDCDFDAAVLMVAHDDLDLKKLALKVPVVLDTRNAIDGDHIHKL